MENKAAHRVENERTLVLERESSMRHLSSYLKCTKIQIILNIGGVQKAGNFLFVKWISALVELGSTA